MALQSATINLTSASSDLRQYLSDWEDDYTSYGNGEFSPDYDPLDLTKVYDQWAIGDTTDSSSSAILDGEFTYGIGGGFAGDVDSLTFGNSLTGTASGGFSQTAELEIAFDNTIAASDTDFTEAIYLLSNYGSLDDQTAYGSTFSGFNSYFDTYGTTINGTSGADVIEAWDGADSVYGGDGNDYIDGAGGDDTLRGQVGQDVLIGGAGNDVLRGGGAKDDLDGGAGDDTLFGGAGQDELDGGTGDDTLTGGGGSDTFVFGGTDFGADTITDFDAGTGSTSVDLIEVSTSAFADWSALSAASAQVGSDVVITYDASNAITLEGVTLSDLDAGDFLFV